MNNNSYSNKNQVILDNEGLVNDEHKEWFSNGSICINPKKIIIHFKPGCTYTNKIQILNMSDRTQIIEILPPKTKIFKFSDITTVSIFPNGLWDLQFTFMSHLIQQSKSYLSLKNSTGHGNITDITVELKAVPKTNLCCPMIINFGNVDIGMSVSRKLCLIPEANPYQFCIFIPHGLKSLSVNPTYGEVFGDSPTTVTIIYTPQSYITLCTDLVLYILKDNLKPKSISLTAVTKPKIINFTSLIVNKVCPKKIRLLPCLKKYKKETKNEITVFNRLTLNKMLMKKKVLYDDTYTWLNSLGELNKMHREIYKQKCKKFIENAKCFGSEHENGRLKISRCEPFTTGEEKKRIIDKRSKEWIDYKEKLCLYSNISSNNLIESWGLRKRSIRTNHIVSSEFDFDTNIDDNWWIRFQSYNKLVNGVKSIIIKSRLEKRLNDLKLIVSSRTK